MRELEVTMKKFLKNYWFILCMLAGIVAGCLVGAFAPSFGSKIEFLGTLFINMMFCVVVPMVFCSIASAIANMKSVKRAGKIMGVTIATFLVTAAIAGVLTGKGREFGGSLIRPEATGYGNIYFLMEMLKTKGTDLKGKTCLVSGSGNVAQYTVEKVIELGGKVVTMSDSDGYIYDPDGIDREKLDFIMELKNLYRGRIREYAEKYGCKYVAGARPWGEKGDIALPSATQNELNGDEAKQLVANGVIAVSEGANMPSTPEAIRVFQEAKILYAPGKAANAGGVSVSGLEMTQNSIKLGWSQEEVDEKLKSIMKNIHEACVQYGTEADGYVNYVKGANVAGFMKVAKAMMAQGIV